jgi:hypothetical protein
MTLHHAVLMIWQLIGCDQRSGRVHRQASLIACMLGSTARLRIFQIRTACAVRCRVWRSRSCGAG